MAFFISEHVGLFMFLWIIGSVAAGESLERNADQEVRAEPGEDVLLQCSSSTHAAITVLKWKRPELDDYVFFFRDNRLYESYQDPRYRGRVELTDPEMKNGNASVLLKNVSVKDSGTYQCWVVTSSNNRRKRDMRNKRELVRSINLFISEGSEKEINDEHYQYGDANDEQPEGPGGYVGLGVSLGLVCLTVGGVVVVGLVVKSKRAKVKRPLEIIDHEPLTCPRALHS